MFILELPFFQTQYVSLTLHWSAAIQTNISRMKLDGQREGWQKTTTADSATIALRPMGHSQVAKATSIKTFRCDLCPMVPRFHDGWSASEFPLTLIVCQHTELSRKIWCDSTSIKTRPHQSKLSVVTFGLQFPYDWSASDKVILPSKTWGTSSLWLLLCECGEQHHGHNFLIIIDPLDDEAAIMWGTITLAVEDETLNYRELTSLVVQMEFV